MKYFFCITLIYHFIGINILNAQSVKKDVFYNKTFDDNIISVKINPLGWDLAQAIISLNGGNKLLLSFDDISDDQKDYSYKIIHCDYMWRKSSLIEMDFIDGFPENDIRDYEDSFNTKLKYIHYKLTIPNEDVSFKISGNYIIQIFESFNSDKIVLQARFSISEDLISIKAKVKHPINVMYRNTHQELEFSIFHENIKIDNPIDDVKIIIHQNNLIYEKYSDINPTFIRNKELVYDSDYIFPAFNEYRNFDLKSMRYQSRYIKNIESNADSTYVELYTDKSKLYKSYLFEKDLNGKYVVDIQEYENPAIEADYAWVKFTLQSEILDKDVFVYGQFTGFRCSEKNKMIYDTQKKSYVLSLLLKQGYYNYAFAVLNNKDVVDLETFEGSFWQTENDYFIYVYYYDVSLNCDRLIGFDKINSLTRL